MKEMLIRALRTFGQAAVGYIAANIVIVTTDAGADSGAMKTALVTLITAAVAAGIAAVMNLPAKK